MFWLFTKLGAYNFLFDALRQFQVKLNDLPQDLSGDKLTNMTDKIILDIIYPDGVIPQWHTLVTASLKDSMKIKYLRGFVPRSNYKI